MDSDPRALRCLFVGFCELESLLAVALILGRVGGFSYDVVLSRP